MTAPVVRFLTGITTSGTPHLGNYVGALRPAVEASRRPGTENFYFLADYHALIKVDEPARVQRSTLEIAACWLACGLDPEHVYFYRQSDIREIPELTWLLTCVTGKGLLNRAHAYKAQVDKNTAAGVDADDSVTAGLFMYPVLMAADILMFRAHKVPVGRDQVQHLEMARDIASSFNHLYGDHLVLPEAQVDDTVALLPGTDGRKMSKSYDNVIPLFAPRENLRRQIMAIVTDSSAPGEPKKVEGSALFQVFEAFASKEETQALRSEYARGISWADAKQVLFERIDREISPMREKYDALIAHPADIEKTLQRGAEKARALSQPLMAELKDAVGLRNLAAKAKGAQKKEKSSLPGFKQYREADGKFYFKFVDADGRLLAQSGAFDSPKDAGEAVRRLKEGTLGAVQLASGVTEAELRAALGRLADA
ncbi:MAG TPA: tryptophan--tRNA ligase [Ramlibacter sp.]|nr:tryptophan--tRNA ligase [Ramlibacter sp.]